MNEYIQSKRGEFDKIIDFFKKEISSLRTGRANPAILDGVFVEAYGSKMPLSGVASMSMPEARSILIAPWDKNIIKELEKAIVASNLGFTVSNEGDKIRLIVPQLTEENRRELVKKINEKMEASRISLRQARDDIKEDVEKAFKDKDIDEDSKFRFIKELEEEVAKENDKLKNVRDKKENEIMTI